MTVVSTAAMAVSMLPLFVLGALGPVLVAEFGLAQWHLGALVAGGFGVAAVLSLPAGALVDRVGAGRSLVGLFVVGAAVLGVIVVAPSAWVVAVGVALGGVPQALANPATNKVILAVVEPAHRGRVTGWKQSGVQVGAFVAGVPLAAIASIVDWRWGVAALALLCLAVAPVARMPVPHSPPKAGGGELGSRVPALAVFSLALGFGLASVNTYFVLYGVDRLGLSAPVAAWLIAVMGVLGIAGRVLWSGAAGRADDSASVLPVLALGAAGSIAVVAVADALPWLVWVGAVGVGVFAVSGNAVSMVAVMRAVPPASAGRAAAVASAGFFGGFALGPPLTGLVLHAAGYPWLWVCVGAAFLAAAAVAVMITRSTR
ncbi:putative arabinose efflux permease, MFS family [Actinokineospora diospyrosa]|uniref:Arabinose efflux permease, MFS family n=1 Tax=Actinokineospora diospyrosa TaxID=103728 RepID=A0ABT1I685_9PSEU|nr:putative arabinose efflux permease, MFS family [Actinokineospora diospyrosa]